MKEQNYQQLFDALEKQGISVPPEYKSRIHDRIENIISYEPRIGVFGKTGAGKSSLCNAVFGSDVCPISNVEACTRVPQEVILSLGNKGLKLIDVPGVGESKDRDEEYKRLYKSLLPELDLVLWVLKGDDRAFTSDEACYKEFVKPYIDAGKPFIMVINQVDKIEPFREWSEENRQPGATQAHNIEEKRRAVASYFSLPLNIIIPVSANEKFGLVELVDSIMYALPNDKKLVVLREVKKENISENAKEDAKDGFWDTVIDAVVDNIPIIPKELKSVAKAAAKKAREMISNTWDAFFPF
jgi:hypothetical protein